MRSIFEEPNPRVTDIFERWEQGYQVSRVLQVGVEVGVFPALSGSPASAGDLAQRLGLDPEGARKLCAALTAMGLLEHDGHAYRNTELAEAHLVPGRPLYRGDGIEHGGDLYFRWSGLGNLVREGRWGDTPAHPAPGDAGATRRFILAMHNYSVAGRAQAVALAADLDGARRLLDLGGGPGTYSIALCQRFPGLEATVRDLAHTHPYAREVIESYGMQDRVRLEAGSWDDEDWGRDYDAVLMSNVLHGRSELNQAKVRRAHAALRAGGQFLVHDFVVNPDGRGPLSAALFDFNVAAYRFDDLVADLRAAGFTDVRGVPLTDSPQTLVVCRKPGT
ncbi:MAG: methyltransferase [Armatimonadetes bacterium]|nr:methyltransferase [Armatimonadota bacterium]